jgi:hypothetical protein
MLLIGGSIASPSPPVPLTNTSLEHHFVSTGMTNPTHHILVTQQNSPLMGQGFQVFFFSPSGNDVEFLFHVDVKKAKNVTHCEKSLVRKVK